MLQYFKKRAARQKAENQLAEMRIMLDAILQLIADSYNPEETALYMVHVGSHIRSALEHRFGWARETFIESDVDLRAEEKIINSLSDKDMEKLLQRVTAGADASGKSGDDKIEKTIALRLLAGWITCKLMARNAKDEEIIRQVIEHERLHLDHIRNMMRILRGESPV